MLWRIYKYLGHQFHRRYRHGRHIHAPYLFEFVNRVVFNAKKIEVPGEILALHRELKRDRSMIPVGKLGATSNVGAPSEGGSQEKRAGSYPEKRSVGSFVRHSSVRERYGALLYRTTRWFRPDVMVELGSGLGISSLYLASGSPETPLHSIEGDTDRASLAAQLICRSNLGLVTVHWGEMDQKMDDLIPLLKGRFVAFVDGNHQYEPTVNYVKKLIDAVEEESVIIMDDIYWSKGMYEAWREVISWPGVRVSIDLFQMGILLLRRDIDKAHIKIRF